MLGCTSRFVHEQHKSFTEHPQSIRHVADRLHRSGCAPCSVIEGHRVAAISAVESCVLDGFHKVLLCLQDALRHCGIPEADKGDALATGWDVHIVELAKLLKVKLEINFCHVRRDPGHEQATPM